MVEKLVIGSIMVFIAMAAYIIKPVRTLLLLGVIMYLVGHCIHKAVSYYKKM